MYNDGALVSIGNSRALSEYRKLPDKPPKHYSCSRGPYQRDYYLSGYFYWPPVKVWLCDDLYCKYPGKCIPTKTRYFYRWVVVYKCTKYQCYFTGIRYLKFTYHVSCKCIECTRDSHCRKPKKCNKYTWTCECPYTGYCRKGYEWNRYQCKCVKKHWMTKKNLTATWEHYNC